MAVNVEVVLKVDAVRLVCAECGRFCAHGRPDDLVDQLFLPLWNERSFGCPVHGQAAGFQMDPSASQFSMIQRPVNG